MAEGWLRHYALAAGLDAEVLSAGTEATSVKPDAIKVMAEVGIDLSAHSSKTLYDLDDPWNMDVVITVCDSANEVCPVYPAKTTRLHVPFRDPSGRGLDTWREVRGELAGMSATLVRLLVEGGPVSEEALLLRRVGAETSVETPEASPKASEI